MGTKRTYEDDPKGSYAHATGGPVISRSLFGVIERGDMPLDGGYGEAEIIEVRPQIATETPSETMRVRVDSVPQDTIATSPDNAAAAAVAIHSLNGDERGQLGFRVEYNAD